MAKIHPQAKCDPCPHFFWTIGQMPTRDMLMGTKTPQGSEKSLEVISLIRGSIGKLNKEDQVVVC